MDSFVSVDDDLLSRLEVPADLDLILTGDTWFNFDLHCDWLLAVLGVSDHHDGARTAENQSVFRNKECGAWMSKDRRSCQHAVAQQVSASMSRVGQSNSHGKGS